MKAISEYTGVGLDEISADGLFSMSEVECLGACVNAPMLQVNNEWVYEVSHHTYQMPLAILHSLAWY